jgi:hypothetical protein
MADKILRFVFSGISTLYPGPPRKRNESPPDKAFVLMAANEKQVTNDWNAPVEPHFPFVYVPESLLVDPIPEPDERADGRELGTCNIYYLVDTRVTLGIPPQELLDYYIDRKRDLGERPGSDDVAGEDDIRWLADIRDLLKGGVKLKSDPSAPGPEVASIVELTGGRIKAGFPCKSVQAQTFRAASPAGPQVVPGIKRVLASEFYIDMTYPERTEQVKLLLQPLRSEAVTKEGSNRNELTLRWPKTGELVVRMGNDTKAEARLASSPERCNARVRSADGKPVLKPRDDDFFLHYQLLDLPKDALRPLPQAGPHQTDGDRCKPAGG